MKTSLSKFILLLFTSSLLLLFLWGCKDTEQDDSASLLEQCKLYLDESEWEKAIEACEDAGGDDGNHYAAQAYMGQGGLSLFNLIRSLTDTNQSSGATSAIFSYVPTTAEAKTSLITALGLLMGSSISNKSQTVYLEGLLVSTILVFTELKDVFGLAEEDGEFSTCDIDVTDTSDPKKCSFTLSKSGSLLTFSGIGSTFYTNLCCPVGSDSCSSVGSDIDNTQDIPTSTDYNVTIDSCAIEDGSVLNYNKSAYDNYEGGNSLVDDEGNNLLADLDFYTLFDSGDRYSTVVNSNTVSLCKAEYFTDLVSGDAAINDCEVIGAVLDEDSELF